MTLIDDINDLINYAVKNGYADDSACDWSLQEKAAYYDKCQAMDLSDISE